MKLRIGKIPYLNSVLFYHPLESGVCSASAPLEGHELQFVSRVPRQLTGAARDNDVHAGPVPLVTCWEIEDRYQPLDDFCIATIDKARSILLFSKRPFDKLDGASIGVTAETSTSVRLMRVLLQQVWDVRPRELVGLDWPRNDAFLLIGDEALLHSRGVNGYPHVADLGEVWNDWTGLPFVFARWMVRHDLEAPVRGALTAAMTAALEHGWAHIDEAIVAHRTRIGLSVEEMREYLEGFHFRMGDAEHQAVERFRQLDAAIPTAGAASAEG